MIAVKMSFGLNLKNTGDTESLKTNQEGRQAVNIKGELSPFSLSKPLCKKLLNTLLAFCFRLPDVSLITVALPQR